MAGQAEAVRRLALAITGGLGDDEVDAIARDLDALAAALAADSTLRSLLANPALPPDRRSAILTRLADLIALSAGTRRIVETLCAAEVLPLLPEIAGALARERDRRRGVARARVVSARPLDDAERARLRAVLARLTGLEVAIEETIDPSLIGGLTTRIGSTLYDGSLRSRLAGLRGRIAGA